MADDFEGGDEGASVGAAFLKIGADMSPLIGALTSGRELANPLATASNMMREGMTSSLTTVGDAIGSLMSGKIGNALSHGAGAIVHKFTHTFRTLLSSTLGQTLGGTIGAAFEGVINKISDTVFGTLGKAVNAAMAPVAFALRAPLGDFNRWVTAAISAEHSLAKFNAVAQITGETTGWTANQIRNMIQSLTSTTQFSKSELMGAAETLMHMDSIRGPVFKRALSDSADLAALLGGDVTQAAHMLAMALEAPENGMMMLRRAGIVLDDQQRQTIKQFMALGDQLGAQTFLLDAIEKKTHGLAEAMGGTLEVQLKKLQRSWEGIGKSLGEMFLPITSKLTAGAQFLVNQFASVTGPLFGEIKDFIEEGADAVGNFFKENKDTFEEWAAIIRTTVMDLWHKLRDAVRQFVSSFDTDTVSSWWDSFKTGVTDALLKVSALVTNWDLMKEGFGLAIDYLGNKWQDFKEFITSGETWSNLWESLKAGFAGAIDFVVDIFGKAVHAMSDMIGIEIREAWMLGVRRSANDAINEKRKAEFAAEREARKQALRDEIEAKTAEGEKAGGAGEMGPTAREARDAEFQRNWDAFMERWEAKANEIAAVTQKSWWQDWMEKALKEADEQDRSKKKQMEPKGRIETSDIAGFHNFLQTRLEVTKDPGEQKKRDNIEKSASWLEKIFNLMNKGQGAAPGDVVARWIPGSASSA